MQTGNETNDAELSIVQALFFFKPGKTVHKVARTAELSTQKPRRNCITSTQLLIAKVTKQRSIQILAFSWADSPSQEGVSSAFSR
jgi:hypothetical protein